MQKWEMAAQAAFMKRIADRRSPYQKICTYTRLTLLLLASEISKLKSVNATNADRPLRSPYCVQLSNLLDSKNYVSLLLNMFSSILLS